MSLRVGAVVVTHASDGVLGGLLDGLAEHEPDAPLVVVDDASPGGPPAVEGAELIVNPEGVGYAASCNRGADALRRHEVDVVCFLNPDVRLRGPSLSELARELEARPRVGVATGPVLGPDGLRVPSAWGPTSVRRALAFAAGFEPMRHRSAAGSNVRTRVAVSDVSRVEDDLRVEGHVIGGTMLVRRTCFDELGGFDERFFLYWEDADLCRRARDANWEIRVLPCTPFLHSVPAPRGVLDDEQRWEWFATGAARFGEKHLVPGQARQLEAALHLGRRLRRLRSRG